MQMYKRRMPELYALVEARFGAERAPALFLQFIKESEKMNGGETPRPSYAYVAMRRFARSKE